MLNLSKILHLKCQPPLVKIIDAVYSFKTPINLKQNTLINFVSETTVNCSLTLTNNKLWTIYELNEITGEDVQQIFIKNNPTINYAELVLQPKTLSFGLYKIVYSVTMSGTIFTGSAETYIQITPSGIILSTLKSKQPIYGGTIFITRGSNQQITFNPYTFSYDVDNVAVITSLTFKYSCQIIESNLPQGYPKMPVTNQNLFLDDFKGNSSFSPLNKCFSSASKILVNNYIILHKKGKLRLIY